MTPATIITMVVGLLIPALVAIITKENLAPHVKVLILLLLSTAAGILTGLITSPPSSLSEWWHVGLNIIITFVCAATAEVAAWKPSGATAKIHQLTHGVGIGPKELPKAA